ncbi:hypothetical protein [Acinetobacter sp. ANC 4177]|uniref:hypothetical protein n=1 Tax=Acinetobacter sp. ANC 4177 TaxID=2529838 RepID=UPI0010405963|nr:hypothetical protein [Acinetobacter sp. ANC 4177]TCB75802.1 hypothetical protein E0H91_05285 [Acinetobacter sp. ANC 4177]
MGDKLKEITTFTGCFIAGTQIQVPKDTNLPSYYWKSIENLKVGDLVLSRPEDGSEIQEYKAIVNTFKLEQKPIWVLSALLLINDFSNNPTLSSEIIATPNHPFWVCGIASISGELSSLEFTKGRWSRLDQLSNGDVIQSDDKYFVVLHATQLYQTEEAHIAWALDPEGDGYGSAFDLNTIRETGSINGRFAYNSYHSKNEQGESEYIPYLADVYNFEVEDYHTYYVGTRSFWVHNANCRAFTNPNDQVP